MKRLPSKWVPFTKLWSKKKVLKIEDHDDNEEKEEEKEGESVIW